MGTDDDSQDWFERVWGYREETLYPKLFGGRNVEGIYVLTIERFQRRFEIKQVDPRWLHHGVLRYPPTASSPTWRYVSSGLSNAWEDDRPNPSEPSGYGFEFVLETPSEEAWALNVVQTILAYQLLLGSGRLGAARVIAAHDRIPLNGPIDGNASALTHLVVLPARDEWQDLRLESGTFSILHLVGITAGEVQFGREHGSEALVAALRQRTQFPVTDAHRASAAHGG